MLNNTLVYNKKNTPDDLKNKALNLKDFVEYLNQTIKMFDQHIAVEDFEKKDSSIHKLFVALFDIYMNTNPKTDKQPKLSNDTTLETSDKNRFESDNIAHEMYKTSLMELETTNNEKYIPTGKVFNIKKKTLSRLTYDDDIDRKINNLKQKLKN
jgi:hypothetical protein